MPPKHPPAAYEAFGVSLDSSPHCADDELQLRMCQYRREPAGCEHELHAATHCLKALNWAMEAQLVTQAYWRDPHRALADGLAPSFEARGQFGLLRRYFGGK